MKERKIMKILSISLLALTMVACGPINSSSEAPTPSSDPVSSEPSSSGNSSSNSSEDTPVVKGYKITIGEKEYELTKEETPKEGCNETYSVLLKTATKGEIIKFFIDGVEKRPSCAELGNNIILNEEYQRVVHNDATNVKLYLHILENGIETELEGYQKVVVNQFSAKVNNEDITLTPSEETLAEGIIAKYSVELKSQDVLTFYGDEQPLFIGTNAMSRNHEHKASLPGEYIIEINEYNRLIITEPVLEIHELYLAYVNDVQISPEFVTPNNPKDKAQFSVDLSKGDQLVIKYADGSLLGSAGAIVNCTYTVYINEHGECYPTLSKAILNITATVDGQPLELESRPAGENFATYRITVEQGQVIQFFNDGEPLTYHDGTETTFSYEKSGIYNIYINNQLQVWDEKYREITVSGIESALLNNRNVYIWAWPSNQEGHWLEEMAKVNENGDVTFYLLEGLDNFLLITTETSKGPDWNNVKSQTNDVKVGAEATTATVTWKTKENIQGTTTPSTPVGDGNYGLRGSFDGGDSWNTTYFLTKVNDDVYEGTITATAESAFKVVRLKADDSTYIEEWIGDSSGNDVVVQPGTYKVAFIVSTKTITVTPAN